MSIIEDAIRRIQSPASGQDRKTQPKAEQHKVAQPVPQEKTTEQMPHAHSWQSTAPTSSHLGAAQAKQRTTPLVGLVAAAILTLTVLLLIGGALWISRTLGRDQLYVMGSVASSALDAAPAGLVTQRLLRRPDAPTTESQSGFRLEGIVEGGGDPYAMINGKVLGIGDEIRDAVLVTVAGGAATLRNKDGTETVLRVTHY